MGEPVSPCRSDDLPRVLLCEDSDRHIGTGQVEWL